MVAVSSGVPAGLESPDRIAFPWARPVDQVVPDENAATASVAQAVSGSESPADQNVVEQLPAVAVNQRAVALPAQADERRVEQRTGRPERFGERFRVGRAGFYGIRERRVRR